jgi:hypothetical protein
VGNGFVLYIKVTDGGGWSVVAGFGRMYLWMVSLLMGLEWELVWGGGENVNYD